MAISGGGEGAGRGSVLNRAPSVRRPGTGVKPRSGASWSMSGSGLTISNDPGRVLRD